ncbi:MAG: hypothetical protein M3419_08265 [Actinomycetota bacterium]|nr:hypothetical protein [Actinomycetota bacterium]
MTRTLPRPPPAALPREDRTHLPWLTHGCDRLLDLVVVVLSTWTVVYHVCLLLRLDVPWAVGMEVCALAGWFLLSRWAHRRRVDTPREQDPTGSTGARTAAADSSFGEPVLVAVTVASGVRGGAGRDQCELAGGGRAVAGGCGRGHGRGGAAPATSRRIRSGGAGTRPRP